MVREERSHKMYLEDILVAMQRIEEYPENYNIDKFKNDQKTIDAVVRNFEIIGEASKSLPTEIKKKHHNIPWQEMYYLRNRVSHEYFGVDLDLLWDIAINYLPGNKKEIKIILENEI